MAETINVLVWSEETAPNEIYPNGINTTIAEHLNERTRITARKTGLADPDQGVSGERLEWADVLFWWGHVRHDDVTAETVDRVEQEVREDGLGFVALHPGHYALPFERLIGESGDLGGVRWEEPGEAEVIEAVASDHPIADGVEDFALPKTEMFDEPFDVPEPEDVVFHSTFPDGGEFRSVVTFTFDEGRGAYIRPGHETARIYHDRSIRRLLVNTALWAARYGQVLVPVENTSTVLERIAAALDRPISTSERRPRKGACRPYGLDSSETVRRSERRRGGMSNTGDDLTIGLAGLGAQGIAYAHRFDQFDYTYIGADFDASARAEFEDVTDGTVTENSKDLLEYDLDGLIIALPPKFHEPIAKSALESDIDVLIEKPVAHTLPSARRIGRAATESDANAMVAFYTKFYKSTSILLGYVADGYFGEVTHVDAIIERRRGLPGRGTWFTSQDIAGGGALIDIGIHALDVLMAIYDYSPVNWAWGQTTTQFGTKDDYLYLETASEHKDTDLFDVEDAASVVLEFANGGTVNLRVAWATNNRERHEYRIHGTERGARLDLTQVYTATVGREETDIVREEDITDREILELYDVRSVGENHFVDSRVVAKGVDAYERMLSAFFNGIGSTNSYEKNSIQQGVQVQEVVDSIYRSDREGEPVQANSFDDINRP